MWRRTLHLTYRAKSTKGFARVSRAISQALFPIFLSASGNNVEQIASGNNVEQRSKGIVALEHMSELNQEKNVQAIRINSFVSALFSDKDAPEGVRFWIGKVCRMVNRPSSGKAVKWRMDVALADVPESLWLTCSWFTPVVSASSACTKYDTYEYQWDATLALQENN